MKQRKLPKWSAKCLLMRSRISRFYDKRKRSWELSHDNGRWFLVAVASGAVIEPAYAENLSASSLYYKEAPMPGALQDLRVIDFTHVLNGPFCTMLLGHLGAEIIKIEPPGGDSFRHLWMGKDAERDGWEFLAVNANKKSVVLDLKKKAGVDVARQLIAHSDVLVENFGLGTMERLGLDYESVKPLNPRLIYACSRGYGETGPYAAYGNNAGTNNGMAGWTHTAWEYTGAPGTKALGIGDEAAGVSMALGILAALHARERTGQGQRIEVSMQEAVLGFMTSSMHEHFT